MFSLQLITGPAEPVVPMAELKEYLRIDSGADANRLIVMEAAAVRSLEAYTDLKFVTQTWDVYIDNWPIKPKSDWWDGVREISRGEMFTTERNITLPIGQAQSITEFSTYDDDNEFVEDISQYTIDTKGSRARIGLKLGAIWPTTILRANNAIRFRVVCGYGDSASVPLEIQQAVKELVAHMYENRGDQNEMTIPPHVLTLVNHLRRHKLGR